MKKLKNIIGNYKSLKDIMLDKNLAKLGDAYVNLIYSIALSIKFGKPVGVKVDNRVLAEAVRKAELRSFLPKGLSRHDIGNAAEALLAYGWLKGLIDADDCVKFLYEAENPIEGFSAIMANILKKMERRLVDNGNV